MSLQECAKMPTCNLAQTIHNKWLQQSKNTMICLYKAPVNDLIHAFMQIVNYESLLTDGTIGRRLEQVSLKVRALSCVKIQSCCGCHNFIFNGKIS